MVTEQERAVLSAAMNAAGIIAGNDAKGAAALCAELNRMDLTRDQRILIQDTVTPEPLREGGYRDIGGYLALVDGLDCIENKAWRRKMALVMRAIHSQDGPQMDALIKEAAEQPLDETENDYQYIAAVIRMCQLRQDYKSMELIRGKLVG